MRTLAIFIIVFAWSGGFAGEKVDEQYRHFILNWQAPYEAVNVFPYFISGYDKDGSPVCVFPFGGWDVRGFLEKSKNNNEIVRRYTDQMFTRFHESNALYKGADPLHGYVIIADLDQYSLRQVTHLGALGAVFDTAIQFARLNRLHRRVKRVYVVNANLIFRFVYTLIRPVLGRLGTIVELHSTNSLKWIPILLRTIPPDQLPAKLGGSLLHKPVEVYG